MNNIDYTAAIKLHKEASEKIRIIQDDFRKKIAEVYGEENAFAFCTPFGDEELQAYPDKPSDNAVFRFQSDNADFYYLKVGNDYVTEAVRKGVKE